MEQKRTGLSYVFTLAKEERGKLSLGMLLAVFSSALSFVPYLVVYQILLLIIKQEVTLPAMLGWAGIGIAAAVLQAILTSFAGICSHTAAFNTMHRIKVRVLEHMSKFNLGFFQEHAPGQIKTTLFDDVDRIETFLAHSTLELAQAIVVPLMMFIFMLRLNWIMALIMLVPMILGIAIPMALMGRYPDLTDEFAGDTEKLNASANEFITAMPVIKMYHLTAEKFEQYRNSLKIYAKRDIWTADMIRLALDKCTDSKLYVAMNLSFACSLRMGEILGLTWENVHISDEDIAADNAYVYIDKELTRASKRAIETLGEKDIYYIFTPLMPNTSTRIILKKPKTDSSIRKVWLPKTLAYILREWKKSQDELKGFLGDEYQDFNLVVALPNGRPCEDRIILKEFAKLREDAGLPKVVFHSLRHSSTTYKLKLNHGDLKATQGDTGHAEIDMITSIYAHILDEDRKVNAQKFETAFYAKPDLRNVRPPEEPAKSEPATLDLESLVEQLQKSPELASALAALIAAQAPAK